MRNYSIPMLCRAAVLGLLLGCVVGSASAQTARWSGTIMKTVSGGGHDHTIDIVLTFDVSQEGAITGRARARISTRETTVSGCKFLWTYAPAEFDIPVRGRRDQDSLEIVLDPPSTTATVRGCDQTNTFPDHLSPAVYAVTRYRVADRDGATDTIEITQAGLPWGVVMRDTIRLKLVSEIVPRG